MEGFLYALILVVFDIEISKWKHSEVRSLGNGKLKTVGATDKQYGNSTRSGQNFANR